MTIYETDYYLVLSTLVICFLISFMLFRLKDSLAEKGKGLLLLSILGLVVVVVIVGYGISFDLIVNKTDSSFTISKYLFGKVTDKAWDRYVVFVKYIVLWFCLNIIFLHIFNLMKNIIINQLILLNIQPIFLTENALNWV